MNQREIRDIKIGLIGGILGFLLIVLPLLKLMDYIAEERGKPIEPMTIRYTDEGYWR